MVRHGIVMSKTPLIIFSVVIFITALVYLSWVLPQILTNPCWRKTLDGLQPLVVKSYGTGSKAIIIMDDECLSEIVFTSDSRMCETACNRYYDDDVIRKCLKTCTGSDEGKSFIVAVPKPNEEGFINRVRRMFQKSSFFWYFTGKPTAISVNCEFVGLSIPGCDGKLPTWECKPTSDQTGEKAAKYEIDIFKSPDGKTCTVGQTTEFEGGDFIGGGAGGSW